MIQHMMIGDNPFIGVDHLSQDKGRETLARLNTERIVDVIITALSSGADGFVFSTHPTNLAALKMLKTRYPEVTFDMHPLLPYAQGWVRQMNEKGTMSVLTEFMSKLGMAGKLKAVIGGGISAMTANPFKLLSTFVDAEIEGFVRASNANNQIKTIFLHEIIVDLAVALRMKDLLLGYIDHIRDSYRAKPGLVTRNFPRLIRYLESTNQPLGQVRVMTPFNALGFQMNPSKLECERILSAKPELDIVAMSVLAAGLLELKDAVEYISAQRNLKSVVIGVSRIEHAMTTFKAFRI